MTSTEILELLIDHLLDVNMATILLERAGNEYFAHTEWTPKPGSISNGNASGYGFTPGEAIADMLKPFTHALPAEITESEQYKASTEWGNGETKPGSHAAQQKDYKP